MKPPVPLFRLPELEAAFRLILSPDAAGHVARTWWEQFATESVDDRGYFLYEDWEHDFEAPSRFDALAVTFEATSTAAQEAHEQSFFRAMTSSEQMDFLMGFSDFHLGLVALVSDDIQRRVQVALGASDAQMSTHMTDIRRVVKAFAAAAGGSAA